MEERRGEIITAAPTALVKRPRSAARIEAGTTYIRALLFGSSLGLLLFAPQNCDCNDDNGYGGEAEAETEGCGGGIDEVEEDGSDSGIWGEDEDPLEFESEGENLSEDESESESGGVNRDSQSRLGSFEFGEGGALWAPWGQWP